MTYKHDILILQKSRKLPSGLREKLRLENFNYLTIFNPKIVDKEICDLSMPILVIDCSGSKQHALNTISLMPSAPAFCQHPTIFINDNIRELGPILTSKFLFVKTLMAPASADDIIKTIQRISDQYQIYLEKLKKVSPELHNEIANSLLKDKFDTSHGEEQDDSELLVHPAYAEGDTIVSMLQDHLKNLYANGITLEGSKYNSRIDEKFLEKKDCLPKNSKVRAITYQLFNSFRKRERQHLCRTAFISNQLTKVVEIDDDLQENGIAASYLFATAFTNVKSNLFRANYLKYNSDTLRKEIGEKIRNSASQFDNLNSPEIIEILLRTADLIGQNGVFLNDDTSMLAAIVMAADLADRICFHSGFWDPYAAFHLLYAIKRGKLNEVHPKVLSCLIKFITEAISAKKPAVLLASNIKQDPALRKLAQRAKELRINEEERKVELSSLTPGMRTSRPLVTYDGKLLLSPDILLDQDLIWRLWSLAAIRPINTPMVVVDK